MHELRQPGPIWATAPAWGRTLQLFRWQGIGGGWERRSLVVFSPRLNQCGSFAPVPWVFWVNGYNEHWRADRVIACQPLSGGWLEESPDSAGQRAW